MTRAIDIGSGPTRAFGSALPAKAGGKSPPIPLITERTIRPSFGGKGRCPECGSRFFGCCDADSTGEDE